MKRCFFFQNLPAERKWPEINQRVIIPNKRNTCENGKCVSFITMNVSEVGIKRVMASWNSHSIEGLYHLETLESGLWL